MIRHIVVYHGYNEHLFAGRAHLRAFLGDNWTALEPSGGAPTSPADLTSFIRSGEASAVFAAYALPAFGDNADLKIRSIVPIGHPIARAFVNYRRRSGKQGEAESFVEFVKGEGGLINRASRKRCGWCSSDGYGRRLCGRDRGGVRRVLAAPPLPGRERSLRDGFLHPVALAMTIGSAVLLIVSVAQLASVNL